MADRLSKGLAEKIRNLVLLVFDVDGVLTDGGVYLDPEGRETKRFSTKDGLGLELAMKAGLRVALISGRSSPAVSRRAEELGIKLVFQGVKDKKKALGAILIKLKIGWERAAFMGDDLPDLQLKNRVAVFVAPRDAVKEVRRASDVRLNSSGGCGAVREWTDLVLSFRKKV